MEWAECQQLFVVRCYITSMLLEPMLKKGIDDVLSALQEPCEHSTPDFHDCTYEEGSEHICSEVYEYQQVQVSDDVQTEPCTDEINGPED